MINVEKVLLPSRGLLGTLEEVTVRAMKGMEISTIYSSLNPESIDQVLVAVTEPAIDPKKTPEEDKFFILHKTRTLTFGNEIDQTLRCPVCKHVETYVINYDDFEVVTLEEDQIHKTIKLEDGTEIETRIATSSVWTNIDSYKEKRNLPATYAFIFLIASGIGKINGEKKSIGELVEYLENLMGSDLMEISKNVGVKFGLDVSFTVPCSKCKTEIPGGIGINADMFR